jgi:hypothetical protein
MKLIAASIALALMAAACSDDDTVVVPAPTPVEGSEPAPLTPDPAPDSAIKQP